MYQNDSFFINSLKKEKGACFNTISVFKILADNAYHHKHDDEEKANYPYAAVAFIRCVEGKGLIKLTDKKITLEKNECIFVPFHEIEEYKSASNVWGYRWVNFEAKNADGEFELNKKYKIEFSENEDNAFGKLLSCGQLHCENRNYINSLFASYFYSVMLESGFEEEDALLNRNTRIIDEICAYIQQKLYTKISIDDIASFFMISPRRLHQIFTQQLGISPKKYILKKKMEEGYKLTVQTSVPINKIAYMLCFSSPYHFTHEFKKTFSQSPSDVRKMEQIYNSKE